MYINKFFASLLLIVTLQPLSTAALASSSKVSIGPVTPHQIESSNTTFDNFPMNPIWGANADDLFYMGEGWFTFKINGSCFVAKENIGTAALNICDKFPQ